MHAVHQKFVVAAMASKAGSPVLRRHSKTVATRTKIETDSELHIRRLPVRHCFLTSDHLSVAKVWLT